MFIRAILLILGLCCIASIPGFAQPRSLTETHALEVNYAEGSPLAFQRIGGWTWYAGIRRVDGYKVSAGGRSVNAVKIYTREEAGVTKAKLTVLSGPNLEFEENVAEYTVGPQPVVTSELSSFGVVPFKLTLVRASATVASLPTINNQTKSLIPRVEPIAAQVLPGYKLVITNNSPKAVAGFAYNTWWDGRPRFTGMPQQHDGSSLIEPGASWERAFPFALRSVTQSTGEVPPPTDGLQLNISAVIFTDGTYEGDRMEAARFLGYKQGEKVQLRRILTLLKSDAASSATSLGPQIDKLTYHVTTSDIRPLLTAFPRLTDAEIEHVRSAAEVSAHDIQKDLVGNFGSSKVIDPAVFKDAVKAAILKCDEWLAALPY